MVSIFIALSKFHGGKMSNLVLVERTIFQSINGKGDVTAETYGIRVHNEQAGSFIDFVESRDALAAMTQQELIDVVCETDAVAAGMIASARKNGHPVVVDGEQVMLHPSVSLVPYEPEYSTVSPLRVDQDKRSVPALFDAAVVDGRVEFVDTSDALLEGVTREGLTFEEGLSYLRSHQFGTLEHRDMENLDYLFIREDGQLAFFCNSKTTVEICHDLSEFSPENDWEPSWTYLPGSEQSLLIDGVERFMAARTQEPINPAEILPSPK